METVERREETVRFDDPAVLADLFGSQDDHLRIVEKSLGVTILPKGNALNVIGDPLQVEVSVKVLTGLYHVLRKGIPITSNDVVAAVNIVRSDRNAEVASVFQDVVFKSSRNKIITPKSVAQKKYLDAMRDFDIVFGIGPAGTGKTFLAMAMAVGFLLRKEVKRIVLARPAVEAGEKLGFLPGDMAEKVNPYLRPLHDALYTMLEYEQAGRMMERGVIEVAPLAFMRGRTLNDSFVILDEAQHHDRADEDVFDPDRVRIQGGDHGRHHPDGPADGENLRPERGPFHPQGCGGDPVLLVHRDRCGQAPDGAGDHQGL